MDVFYGTKFKFGNVSLLDGSRHHPNPENLDWDWCTRTMHPNPDFDVVETETHKIRPTHYSTTAVRAIMNKVALRVRPPLPVGAFGTRSSASPPSRSQNIHVYIETLHNTASHHANIGPFLKPVL
jgi:hypothetical protein